MRTGGIRLRRKWERWLPCVFASGLAILGMAQAVQARYGSRDEGKAAARVAAFQVTMGQAELRSSDSEAQSPEDQVVYRITLKNESECEALYSLNIHNTSERHVDWEVREAEGRLGIGEEKEVEIILTVPAETFSGLTASEAIEGLRAEAVFTQAEPGGGS